MEKNYEDRFMEIVKMVESGWEMYDRRQNDPINRMKSLTFLNEDLEKVYQILNFLDNEEAVGFIHFPTKRRPSAIFLEKQFSRVLELLNKEWISYIEVPSLPISALA